MAGRGWSEKDLERAFKLVVSRLESAGEPPLASTPYHRIVAVACRLYAGESRSRIDPADVRILRGLGPKGAPHLERLYFGALAAFQYGGGTWRAQSKAPGRTLFPAQRTSEADASRCEYGSWDPLFRWSPAGGRVYATAMGALVLEIYLRFETGREARGRPKGS